MMKKAIALLLAAVVQMSCAACSAPSQTPESASTTAPATTVPVSTVPTENVTEATEESKPEINVAELPYKYQTKDGLLSISLPNQHWGQVYTDEHDVLFSDGDCAIAVDLYRAKDALPTVPTADETHKLIFTSAISADEYVLFLIGYASEQEDFPDLAAAINSITVDKTRITKVWPEEKPAAPQYSVRDTNYTAWVNANALNVRTGSGTDKAIIRQLTRDTKLTVTGEVLEGSNYIGWSRVRLSDGTEGYVSSQFLTTTQPVPKPTKTGNSKTLYSSHGTVYVVYEYSDYNWRTDNGTVYWPATFSTWENASGHVLYDYDPTVPSHTEPQLTSMSVNLYHADGTWAEIVYLATDGEWYTTNWNSFYPAGNGVWYCGEAVYYDYIRTPESPTEPQMHPKSEFENSLWAHDGMIAIDYETIYEGVYEVTCQDPETGATKTVTWNAWDGSWE